MKRRPRDQEKEPADQARLQRDWKVWHREQHEQALVGAHGAVIADLMLQLDQLELRSASMLLARIQRTNWSTVEQDVRLTVLHQIQQTIIRLRAHNGLPPLDDLLPGQPDNIFRRIKQMMFAPPPPGAYPGSIQTKRRNSEQVK